MCAYKLVTCEFKWFGLQGRIESYIQKVCQSSFQPTNFTDLKILKFYLQQERRLFTKFHRQVFCWTDKWFGLTMEDIRKLEAETQKELNNVS